MTIIAIHHVQITIPKGEEETAREFYCGALGLVEIPKPESLQGRGGFWLEIGTQQIHIGTEDGVNRSASKAHIAYQVADVATWRERLGDYGIDIGDSVPISGYDRFECRDPFGNRLEFIQDL
ncbi:MAG: VOC family protein [Aggregatilineales bacterium]